jgi:hypothetical protein
MAIETTVICDGCGARAESRTDPERDAEFKSPPDGWSTVSVLVYTGEPSAAGRMCERILCPTCRTAVNALLRGMGQPFQV